MLPPTEQSGASFVLEPDPAMSAARPLPPRFSQILEPLPAGVSPFRLAARAAGTEAPAETSPIVPDHATTARFQGDFVARRAALAAAIAAGSAGEQPSRQLDYAQFLIAWMMLPEARGAAEAVLARSGELTAADRDRALGYLAIVARLGGGGPADLPPAWAGDPLWPVVTAAGPVGEDRLRAALAALTDQSRAVATAALPLLFDLALAGGQTGEAAAILASAPAGTDLEGTGLLDLMRGRLALAQGAADLGFDTLARVAEGQDRAAVEARVLMTDLALERKDPELLPQLRALLQSGLMRWRGDATALRLRVRLARVAEDMGDIPTAVETMAMILREHPGTPEAGLAETRIGVMVGHLAESLADPALPLPDALAAVRRLDGALAERGDWVAVRLALARRLAAAGLSAAAAAEYAALSRSLPVVLRRVEPAQLDALVVEQAALLMERDAPGRVRAVVDAAALPGPGAAAKLATLRLRAGSTAILPPRLLAALKVEDAAAIPDPGVQLALAGIAAAAGQPDAALAAFDQGLGVAGADLRLTAARVAGEAGDSARAARYAAGLTGDRAEAQRAVAASLAASHRAGGRLSVSGASALVTAAADAGQAVEALLLAGSTP